MNFPFYPRLLKEDNMNPVKAIAYSYILHLHSINGCYIKSSTFAKLLSVSQRYIEDLLAALQEDNWIERKNRRMKNGRRTRRIFPKRFLHLPREVPNNRSESNKEGSFQSVKESSEDMFENKEKSVIENPSEIPRNTSGYNIYIKDIYNNNSNSETDSFREEVGSEVVVEMYCANPKHDCVEVSKDEQTNNTPCPICCYPMQTEDSFKEKNRFDPKAAFVKSDGQFHCRAGIYIVENSKINWIERKYV